MNKHTYAPKPTILVPTAVPIHAGSTPQAVALFVVDEYKLHQNTITPDLSKFLVGMGVFNTRVHPVKHGFFVEFVYQGLKIATNVQFACTYQVRKFSNRTRKSVDNVW
jgi:hypothetical protein